MTENKDIEPKRLYWNDFSKGDIFEYGTYLITEEEIISFGIKYDPLDHHVDTEKAKRTPLGLLCASGLNILAIAHKMLCDNLYLRSELVAGRGVRTMKMFTPVLPNDVLDVTLEVRDANLHKYKKDRGWLDLHVDVRRQDRKIVMTYDNDILFMCRP